MKKKYLLTEQELSDLLLKSILGLDKNMSLGDLYKQAKINNSNNKNFKTVKGNFIELDLTNSSHYDAYKQIADRFISSRPSNLLGIKGFMLADAAKKIQEKYGKYIPVELALAQLSVEGGFSNDPKSRPIRTKNPYNVGNTDSGKNVHHSSVQSGIDSYYDLIARNYLVGGKTVSDLIQNFVNKTGKRYASSNEYERMVDKISSQVQNISTPIYASIITKSGEDIA